MKNIKILFVLIIVFFSVSVQAQNKDVRGFTAQSSLGMYLDNEELMSYDCNEIYNVSIADGYFIHNILTDNVITDSQVYKISGLKTTEKDGEMSYSFNAVSGLSGKEYQYTFSFGEGSNMTVTLVQPDGSATVFVATTINLKTYKQ